MNFMYPRQNIGIFVPKKQKARYKIFCVNIVKNHGTLSVDHKRKSAANMKMFGNSFNGYLGKQAFLK